MNNEELDEMLRSLPTPQGSEELSTPRPFPVGELVVFMVLGVVLLMWALGALTQVFGGSP